MRKSFSAAAWWLGQKVFLYDHAGFVRLAIPTTVTVTGLLMCNAYADPQKHSPVFRPILQCAGSISLAFFGQALIFDTRPSFAVPFGIMLYGSCTSLVLVSTLRMLFPPILSSRSKGALLHAPHLSHKPDLIPAKAPLRQIRQRISEVQSPLRLKTVSAWAAALLVAALLFSTTWHGIAIRPQLVVLALVVLLVPFQNRTRE